MGIISGISALAGASVISRLASAEEEQTSGEKMRLLTPDGKLVEVDKTHVYPSEGQEYISPAAARQGIPHRKFVMVIDLAKCKNARACVEKCQKGHNLPPHQEFMKVYMMQESKDSAPYWFPKPCFHCDKPLCVSVCPVGATYKRSDGIVLIDNERCIGCKFCMTGCPYSARVFNWEHYPQFELGKDQPYSPETSVPGVEGTVSKCDFCPDLVREGKLPYCVSSCPMGVIYYGDILEDIVTNGDETIRFSELIKNRAGYRHLEDLGTQPSVYYLPPVNRQFPIDRGLNDLDEEVAERYNNVPYMKDKKSKEDSK
ncbi:MAG: 4Fe-4S dicluster domain-containing protein [Bacteroidales bacterium]|nr:4Fe-4S dicluster domain-containing protein [Bacteroidales bacterium]